MDIDECVFVFSCAGREKDVRMCGNGRKARGAAVGTRERLPVGQIDVLLGGNGRAPRCAAVDARERLPVERGDARYGGAARLRRSVTALAPAACREKEKERRNEEPRKDDKIENSDTTDIKNKSGS